MTESNAVMLPKDVRPSKYTLTLQPNLKDVHFLGQRSHRHRSTPAHRLYRPERRRAGDHVVQGRLVRRGGVAEQHGPGREGGDCSRSRSTPHFQSAGQTGDRVHRRVERPSPRLLPQPLHRHERRGASPGDDPVRGHRRPARLPLLGRALDEGDVRGHAGRPRGARGRLEHHDRRGVRVGWRPETRPVR